ncbi:hypothetical protein SAMN04487939_10325 [Lysobacter sp. yr284]|uniref:hypothetical protein n=1 Tax=Lysobacter sp. yr284 TaxID=1761791 RepID=UPI000898D5BE|nr:hypothetical protein [Lysobacter sp. yr284]SDY52765.1 hypothetical protein SAMN04487939_10325 [Lysobacter sp. yr284]
MGYEYDALPDDPDDYLRRRAELIDAAAALPSFSRRAGACELWLSDPARAVDGWEQAQLVFGERSVRVTCMTALSAMVRADLRALPALLGGARYVDDDGEPAAF